MKIKATHWLLIGALATTYVVLVPVSFNDAVARESVTNGAPTVRLRAKLSGNAFNNLVPSGHADYREIGARKKLKVQAEDVNLPAGTKLTVQTSTGVKLGELTLSGLPDNEGELELDTQGGQTVPTGIATGTIIQVVQGTTLLLAGTLK